MRDGMQADIVAGLAQMSASTRCRELPPATARLPRNLAVAFCTAAGICAGTAWVFLRKSIVVGAWLMRPPSRCQDLDQVHGPDRRARLTQSAGDVHDAPGIADRHHLRAAGFDRPDLGLHHGLADLGVNHAERAAEAAAGLLAGQRDQLQPPHGPQERLGLITGAEPAQQVAGGMVGDLARKTGAHIRHL